MTAEPKAVLKPKLVPTLPMYLILWVIFGTILGLFVGVFGAIVASLAGRGDLFGMLMLGGTGGTLSVLLVLIVLRIVTTEYRIYDDRIEREAGVVATNLKTLDLDTQYTVEYTQSLLDRLFGVGTVQFNTSGGEESELSVAHVSRARELYDEFN